MKVLEQKRCEFAFITSHNNSFRDAVLGLKKIMH